MHYFTSEIYILFSRQCLSKAEIVWGKHGAVHTKMVSPSDEQAMELVEFKFLEYTKPRKEASFNKDKSGRDLEFHKRN